MVVAVIEDHDELRIALGRLLRSAGFAVDLFESAEAYLAAPPVMPHCLLLDLNLPGMSGLDLQRHLRARPPAPPIILTTADKSLAEHAEHLGCDALLLKPVRSDTLFSTVASFIGSSRVH